MKKIIILLVAFMLSGCSSPKSTETKVTPTQTELEMTEVYTIDNQLEFEMIKTSLTDEIAPANKNRTYQYLKPADNQHIFIDIIVRTHNLSENEYELSDLYSGNIELNNEKHDVQLAIESIHYTQMSTTDTLKPQEERYIHLYCEVAKNNTKQQAQLALQVMNQKDYQYTFSLEEVQEDNQVKSIGYYTSNEKTALAIAIANRERHLLKDINYENGYSLYVGIPFCPSICLYCSFSSSPIGIWKDQVDAYLDALCKEIDYASEAFADKELNTVYIGGGTPTTLEPVQLDRLLTKLEERFDYSRLREFTVEAGRPDSITAEKLQVLRDHGISRISVNPQTMNQKTLDLIGRKHTVEQTKEAFFLARTLGFDNINMDLIVGLPGEGQPEVEHTMREITALDPDSITVHSLAVKRASRLRMFRDEYREMTFTNNRMIMDMAASYAMRAGQSPYYLYRQKNMAGNFENVGYSKEGKAGIYNILIMEEVQSILALGAGASTKLVLANDRIERIENVKDIRSYIDRIDEMIERKRIGIHA